MRGSVIEVNFTWVIDNFGFKCQSKRSSDCLKSKTFAAEGDEKIKWQLHCYPKGNKEENKDFISLFLHLISTDQQDLLVKYEFSVCDFKAEEFVDIRSASFNFSKPGGMGFHRFLPATDLLDKSKNYLKEETLTLKCKLKYEVENVDVFSDYNFAAKAPKIAFLQGQINDHLGNLLNSGQMSDITLVIKGEELKAHKLILSARSPVFAQMFAANGTDNPVSRLKIEECKANTFKAFLHFIYTDQMEETEDMAKNLLDIATTYEVQLLKLKCENFLMKHLSTDNCVDILLLSDTHRASYLKKEALDFIHHHAAIVIKIDGWKNMRKVRPHLAFEIFESKTVSQSETSVLAITNSADAPASCSQ